LPISFSVIPTLALGTCPHPFTKAGRKEEERGKGEGEGEPGCLGGRVLTIFHQADQPNEKG
jgi:hypothetical protein